MLAEYTVEISIDDQEPPVHLKMPGNTPEEAIGAAIEVVIETLDLDPAASDLTGKVIP